MRYPRDIESIIELLTTLPGVGRRGAERMVFALLRWNPDKLKVFGALVGGLPDTVRKCVQCGNITDAELCVVCANSSRDASIICVVEEATQIPTIEKSSLFKGLYHVLGGRLSPLDGKGAEDLSIDHLLHRLADPAHPVREIILALSPDVEGRATAIYLADLLKEHVALVSTLAQGIPAGADITFANSATIAAAFSGRTSLSSPPPQR